MKKQKFQLPHMVLHRGDLENFLSYEKSQEISNSDMEEIARKLSNALMQDWSVCLEIVAKEVVK